MFQWGHRSRTEVQMGRGTLGRRNSLPRTTHFAVHWVEVTVKSSLAWGMGLFQCFLTKAQLMFEEGLFLCKSGLLRPLPRALNASHLSAHPKDGWEARYLPVGISHSAQPQSDDDAGKQLSGLHRTHPTFCLILKFSKELPALCFGQSGI